MTDPHAETFRAGVRATFPRYEDAAMAVYEAFDGDDRYVVAIWIALWLTVPVNRAAFVEELRERVEAAYPDPRPTDGDKARRYTRAIEALDALDQLVGP